jgi:hypothetical protein
MPDFPFEAVYDHFAKPLVEMGLKDYEMLPPLMASVLAVDGKLAAVDVLPMEIIGKLFQSDSGKDRLGLFIRMAVSALPNDSCLVLMTEAYMRETKLKEELKAMREAGLKDDPKSVEVVMIKVFTKDKSRVGMLRINADRSLEYGPLQAWESAGGRLSTEQELDDIL